jgi:glycosyltransferase involved in cell wall biosynthesis
MELDAAPDRAHDHDGVLIGQPLRIALVAPPMLPIPPLRYAGTERVIAALADGLASRGHHVTLFAAGDSTADQRIVPTVPKALWSSGFLGDPGPFIALTVARVWRDAASFDVIHSHLDTGGFAFARHAPVPVVSTLHGRLDATGPKELIDEYSEIPLVSVSDNQRRWHPNANWVATVHNGLPLASMEFRVTPGSYLALVGRITSEKGVVDAIELACATGLQLRIAAKVMDPNESAYFDAVVKPALGPGVEFLGEVGPTERDPLLAGALATLMLGAWPEPFGLVAIESLATGTPVIARRAGALPEIIEHGVDGFLVDDVKEAERAVPLCRDLDRSLIRERALSRFGAERMVGAYERVYRELVAGHRLEDRERPAGRRMAMPVFAYPPRPVRTGERTPARAVAGRERAVPEVEPEH